jgi:toxin ParE1/3/4
VAQKLGIADPRRSGYRVELQAIAGAPYRIRGHDREEVAPGLCSDHLIYSRQQAKQTRATVKSPRHIVFYRVANDDVIEFVSILDDAMACNRIS